MKKIKILVASDVHGDKSAIDRLALKANLENVDLVILAGDLTFAEESSGSIIEPFIKNDRPVLLLHGNHESISTIDFLSELYTSAINLHGEAFICNDLGIFGCGGADIGLSVNSEEDFFEILDEAHKKIEGLAKKIMVTHMHALDTDSEFSGLIGSSGIRKAIDKFKPDIFLAGHIHEAEGLRSKIGDTTVYAIGRKGKIIEI